MVHLPEKIRSAIQKVVNQLKKDKRICGIGLFGSWSREDYANGSDVDLLVIDKSNPPTEYVKRIEMTGVLIDLNFVPKKWIIEAMPPEIDQKIHEAYILYDRDWSFASCKEWLDKFYYSEERLNLRTESYMVDSDIYFSRAASAQARQDFESAYIFAGKSLENSLKILIEACRLPICNSCFIQNLERATEKLEMITTYAHYLAITNLNEINDVKTEKILGLFKETWDEISYFSKRNKKTLEKLHFNVKSKLEYYISAQFLQGTILRTRSLINNGKNVEAAHYIRNITLEMLENYLWLKAETEETKADPTTLFRFIKETAKTIHKKTREIFHTEKIKSEDTQRIIGEVKEINLKIRRQRKNLIQQALK